MAIDTVLFDFDGTLANTIPGITATLKAMLTTTELNFSLEKATALIGQPLAEMGNILVGPEKSAEFVNAYFREFPEHGACMIQFFPETKTLLQRLKKEDFLTGVVTSKRGTSLAHNLEVLKAQDTFDILVTNDKTIHHKPHPEPVEYALDKLGREPGECVMVGDTQYDILAAAGAGVTSIGVTWGVETRQQLKSSQPTYIVDTMEELGDLICQLKNK